MSQSAWTPFCAAVDTLVKWEQSTESDGHHREQLAARADALGRLVAVFEDGEKDPLPLSELLRLRGLPDSEAMALSLCSGSVLDVGAGTGAHSLLLQDQGVEVTAMDAQPVLVELMRQRGVDQVFEGDVLTLQAGTEARWDTLLFMMNGLGLCGDLEGLLRLLVRCHGLVQPGGVVLADGCDLRLSPAPEEVNRIRLRKASGRKFCESRLRMEFAARNDEEIEPATHLRGLIQGSEFRWLYVDYATLESVADTAGWSCQCVFSDGAEYLARLSPAL